MLKTMALIGVGAAIAFTPLPIIAQTDQSAAPAAAAPAATAPTGSLAFQGHSSALSRQHQVRGPQA